MSDTTPTPYVYDGRKQYLKDATKRSKVALVVSNGLLYLGEVLEHICFEIQKQNVSSTRMGAGAGAWFPDVPPCNGEHYDPDGEA